MTQETGTPRSRLRRLRVLQQDFDAAVAAAATRALEQGYQISCRRGCAACCHHKVEVFAVEAVVLVEHERAAGRLAALLERAQAQLDVVGDSHDPDNWKRHRLRCVFLASDDTCEVYELRPLMCRGYLVGSPAEQCSIDSDQGVDMLDVSVARARVFGPLWKLRPAVGVLPKMLLEEARKADV